MPLFDFARSLGRLRLFLGKAGLLPRFMERSGRDRRVLEDRRVRSSDQYLITEGADRRFQPERRSRTERRAGTLDMEDFR